MLELKQPMWVPYILENMLKQAKYSKILVNVV